MGELEEIRARKLAELRATAQRLEFQRAAKPFPLTDATFDPEIAKGGVVLVDLWAVWCGPCLRVAPILEQLAMDYAGQVRVGKLNVDENPTTPARFGVQAIPTLLLFKDGDFVERIVGAVPRQEIERALARWL